MAEYLIQGETLTAIGDKIRVLNGAEDAMTPSEMTSAVGEVNTEVSTQADLIAQITNVLQGKSGGSGGTEIETCTGTISFGGLAMDEYPVYYVDENLDLQTVDGGNTSTIKVMKNSIIYSDYGMGFSGGATGLVDYSGYGNYRAAYVSGDFSIDIQS